MGGPLTVANGGTMTIAGNVALDNVLTNAGTVVMTGMANLVLYNNNLPGTLGAVYNLAGALWDIQTNASVSGACYGHEFFDNAGMFRKSLGTGGANVGTSFTNNGTVGCLTGTLSFTPISRHLMARLLLV